MAAVCWTNVLVFSVFLRYKQLHQQRQHRNHQSTNKIKHQSTHQATKQTISTAALFPKTNKETPNESALQVPEKNTSRPLTGSKYLLRRGLAPQNHPKTTPKHLLRRCRRTLRPFVDRPSSEPKQISLRRLFGWCPSRVIWRHHCL